MPTLPDATRIGAVDLNVRDLDGVAAFYRDALGFREHERDGALVALGADEVLLRLHASPDATPRAPRQAGLFHVAYLVPTRADLGRVIRHLVDARVPLQGASDHLVSEALYLADPEGNGIEVYADRPRAVWPRMGGEIRMDTRPMDVRAVIAEGGDARFAAAPPGTRVGHMHVQAVDVPAAQRWYQDVVGLDVQMALGASASFLSAGGYHHHLGVNAWGTQDGLRADPSALGLRSFELLVPDEGYEAAVKRVGGTLGEDPSGNRVELVRG